MSDKNEVQAFKINVTDEPHFTIIKLVEGCQLGAFVLRLTRPDGSSRTWWYSRPDETAMNDPSLELILSEAAELQETASSLLEPERLPDLWKSDAISVQALIDYLNGTNVVQVQRDGYMESLPIPRASTDVVTASVKLAVESGALWLINAPASILAEPIPAGVLTEQALLQRPPGQIMAAEILPETLAISYQNYSRLRAKPISQWSFKYR